MPRSDRLVEAHDRLTRAVEALVTGDDWLRFLQVARRFHTYSANNVLLILAQRSDATRVAGFRTWKGLGRHVRAGERGVAILAPIVSRARPLDDRDEAERPEVARILRGFRVVHVFDVTQTDGEPLPEVPRPVLLAGGSPAPLWDALAAQVGAAGFALERGGCGEANGRTDFGARTVRVSDDLDGAQAAKTLAHELAHVLLHDGSEPGLGCRGRAEVEAESVAYLVCSTTGLDSDAYSFPYVAGWCDEPGTLRATAERVIACARNVVTTAALDAEEVVA